MMLVSPPSYLYNNPNLHKTSSYQDIKGKNPEPKTLMHPCYVVFAKEDMDATTFLFICEDQDAIDKMLQLQLYNNAMICLENT